MTNLGTLIESVLDEVDTRNERTERNLRRTVPRSLKAVRAIKSGIMEKTALFSTAIDQKDYTVADSGFPPDIISIESLTRANYATVGYEFAQVTIAKLSEISISYPSDVSAYGHYYWCWYANALKFAPTPTAAIDLSMEYIASSLYDDDGNNFSDAELDGSDDTWTNAWFREGEPVLRAHLLRDYYRYTAKDGEAAALVGEDLREQVALLEAEWNRGRYTAVADRTF